MGGGAVEDCPGDAMAESGCDCAAANVIGRGGGSAVNDVKLKLPNFSKPFLITCVIC